MDGYGYLGMMMELEDAVDVVRIRSGHYPLLRREWLKIRGINASYWINGTHIRK